ncbi:UNVERIFIED_CONTAM: protein transport protein SEC13B [Sesamum calycinum]|uniref:Protein transport protein SEC13B n=1 Tax=Sesamum calycinum TaxID=2727403 RepID=A0AAW2NGG2_9LAMI
MPGQKIETGHQDVVHDVAMDYYGICEFYFLGSSRAWPLSCMWILGWEHLGLHGKSRWWMGQITNRPGSPIGVTSVSWAPSTAPGALVGSGLLDPVQKLASGGCDNTVKVWKFDNGTWRMDCFPALSMHTDWVRDVAWAPNLGLPKSTIASASQDGKVIIWTAVKEGDRWDGKVLKDFGAPVWRVSWSLTGNILAVADGKNNVTLWKEAVDGEWQQVTTVEP